MQVTLKFHQILAALKMFHQFASRTFVTLRKRIEHSMPLEQADDGVHAVLQVALWPNDRHGT